MSEKNSFVNDSSIKQYAMEIIKAIIIAVIISLLLVVASAFAVKFFSIDTHIIPIINQVIRSLSIFLAIIFSFKKEGNGWLRGIIAGLGYSIMAFCIFSLLAGGFVWDISLMNNLVLGALSGFLSGIVSMLIRRK